MSDITQLSKRFPLLENPEGRTNTEKKSLFQPVSIWENVEMLSSMLRICTRNLRVFGYPWSFPERNGNEQSHRQTFPGKISHDSLVDMGIYPVTPGLFFFTAHHIPLAEMDLACLFLLFVCIKGNLHSFIFRLSLHQYSSFFSCFWTVQFWRISLSPLPLNIFKNALWYCHLGTAGMLCLWCYCCPWTIRRRGSKQYVFWLL